LKRKKSDSSTSLQESEDSGSDLKGQIIKTYAKGHEAHHIYNPMGIAPTVRDMYGKVTKIDSNVSSPTNGINTVVRPITRTSAQKSHQLTLGMSKLDKSQLLTYCVLDFLARASRLLES